jgi:hypothetical protein
VIGQVPHGARLADVASGTVLIDDPEAAFVRMMYRWRIDEAALAGCGRPRAHGADVFSITRAVHRVRPRRARVWAKTSIPRILSDPF